MHFLTGGNKNDATSDELISSYPVSALLAIRYVEVRRGRASRALTLRLLSRRDRRALYTHKTSVYKNQVHIARSAHMPALAVPSSTSHSPLEKQPFSLRPRCQAELKKSRTLTKVSV